jgi:hypothetical protein
MIYQSIFEHITDPIEFFFALARERQSIFLKKERGEPRPWTEDGILNHFKFTNVRREQDKTTKWFRENVRDRLRDKPEVLLATVLFRWFNRIEIGEVIFGGCKVLGLVTPWDWFLKTGEGKILENVIRSAFPKGPYVTGAYLITSPIGMDKLSGICKNVEGFYNGDFEFWADEEPVGWIDVAEGCLSNRGKVYLQGFWNCLKKIPFQGPFLAYEIVTDLRHTALLDEAPDINTWANAGPGAKRGLNRLHGRPLNGGLPLTSKPRLATQQANEEMIALLEMSRDTKYWPNNDDYPPWELREVEQWLCEADKMLRILTGQGRTRSIYR